MHPGLADIVALPEPVASLATEAHFLMCPPRHYAVSYSINPWMDPKAWADGGGTSYAASRAGHREDPPVEVPDRPKVHV